MNSRITAKIETITPSKAASWLELMVPNRNPKEATIAMYANDMLNGKWLLSPQGIAFDDEGRLFDGQNRLMAIIRAQVAIDMLVLRGFPVAQANMKTMDVLDSGVGRSIADRLRLMGAYPHNPNLTSAIARQIVAAIMGNSRSARKISIAVVIEICRLWKTEMNAVCSVLDRPQYRHARNSYTAAAFTIAAAADLTRIDRDMGRFLSGAGLESGNPLLELRNAFLSNSEHIDSRQKTVLCLSAIYCTWNDLQGRAFQKTENINNAIAYFRSSQPKRFSSVEKLFHSPTA